MIVYYCLLSAQGFAEPYFGTQVYSLARLDIFDFVTVAFCWMIGSTYLTCPVCFVKLSLILCGFPLFIYFVSFLTQQLLRWTRNYSKKEVLLLKRLMLGWPASSGLFKPFISLFVFIFFSWVFVFSFYLLIFYYINCF